MSERQQTSEYRAASRRLRVGCVAFALAVCGTTPALASTPATLKCKQVAAADLHVPNSELAPRMVSHEISVTDIDATSAAMELNELAPERLLAPQAEQAIRDAFDDNQNERRTLLRQPLFQKISSAPLVETDDELSDEADQEDVEETAPSMNTRLPGISDADLLLYKKQMYRRDI